MRRGVLLDRDGVIIVDHGYVGSIDRVEFLPGAPQAIAALNRAGLPVAVVTNQAGVARGLYGIDDVQQVHKHMTAELARYDARVDLWLFCPYHPDGIVEVFARASSDRKPGPGMALAAAQALDLDLRASWVVGDSPVDMGLAQAVGACAVHVGPAGSVSAADVSFPDLAAAVAFIVESGPACQTPDGPESFPAHKYVHSSEFTGDYLRELGRALASVDPTGMERAARILIDAYERDAAVFACGNGGSASIANHLQCDHVKTLRVPSLPTWVEAPAP